MIDFDALKKSAAAVADSALRATVDLAGKGKQQMDRLALENRLRRAQQELGALVYALHRAGEENPQLVQRYIDAVAQLDEQLSAMSEAACARQPAAEPRPQQPDCCPHCGAEVQPGATFCGCCGAKLG